MNTSLLNNVLYTIIQHYHIFAVTLPLLVTCSNIPNPNTLNPSTLNPNIHIARHSYQIQIIQYLVLPVIPHIEFLMPLLPAPQQVSPSVTPVQFLLWNRLVKRNRLNSLL